MHGRHFTNLTKHFLKETPLTYSAKDVESALLAAKEVGPYVYTIINYPSETILKIVYGCQGDKGEGQAATAKMMALIPHHEKTGCGDNFYPNGIESPDDERFSWQFYELYGGTPNWMIIGNHDENLHNVEKYKTKLLFFMRTPGKTGREVGINQIAHTYLHKDRHFFQNTTLDFDDLPAWILPHDYYSDINGKVQTFHLNTNRIARDYLDYLQLQRQGLDIDPRQNQIAWLLQEYQKARDAKRMVHFVQHHPFFCYGKRAYESVSPIEPGWDGNIYLKTEEIKKLDLILQLPPDSELINDILTTDEKNLTSLPNFPGFSKHYNETTIAGFNLNGSNIDFSWVLRKILFSNLGCCPDISFSAHEHSLHKSKHVITINNKGVLEQRVMLQIVSGGGGGKLQERFYFGGSGKKAPAQSTPEEELPEEEYLIENDILSIFQHKESEDINENNPASEDTEQSIFLQERQLYGKREKISVFSEKNGFFIHECDKNNPENSYIHLYYINGTGPDKKPDPSNRIHLKFNYLDSTPLRETPTNEMVESLRLCVLKAIKKYQAFLHMQQIIHNGHFFSFTQNLTHKISDVRIADNAKNYLNQYEALDLSQTIEYLHTDCFSQLCNKNSPNSLFLMVNEEIESLFGKSLGDLFHEITDNKPSIKFV